ncbi:hypothetical protein [Photobacterium leiognathi]|uniref:hypothetical protein n=1 Tax=Photobacterium leiognathi TaxID=553611 RepID=UPI002981F037|nr:hypothetical protein [Photobacterium leiognathi]
MKDPDIELSKWKQERKKGRFRFVVRTATPVIVGMMIWWSIEPMFISETAWGWAQTIDILSKGFGAVVGAITCSCIWWRERKYKCHIAKFDKHI